MFKYTIDFSIPIDDKVVRIKSTPTMTESELKEYKKYIEKYYKVEIVDIEKWDENYNKNEFPQTLFLQNLICSLYNYINTFIIGDEIL